jgi:hypothetical protein
MYGGFFPDNMSTETTIHVQNGKNERVFMCFYGAESAKPSLTTTKFGDDRVVNGGRLH